MSKEKLTYQDSDKELVARAKKDRNAFAPIYDKYFEPLYYFIFKRVQDEAIAGDICQEAMLKAMFNVHKFEFRGIPFSAWLYRIASNEVNLYFRKNKKVIQVEVEEKHVISIMQEIDLGKADREDDQDKLIVILDSLKPEYTEIIELRFFYQYSFKEIAEFYEISEANAKMRLYRILEKIKKNWGPAK